MIQQQVEEIKFEQVYIQKLRHKALKTGKISNWLQLLKAYHQNNLFQEKDQAINQMHFRFILKQDFWNEQISRKLQQQSISEKDAQFMFMSIEDGYYRSTAKMLCQFLLKQLKKCKQKSGNFRPNYLIAKYEKIITIFQGFQNFYPGLRNYYKLIQNDKKVRQLYMRQIKLGFNNIDVVYDQYKLWQQNKSQIQRSKTVYEEGLQKWQTNVSNQNTFQLGLNQNQRKYYENGCLQKLEELGDQYLLLYHLRIFCLQYHELVNQYFEKLQFVHRQDEQFVARCYSSLINTIPQLQMPYLRFLVRRFNKHVLQTQDEEYNQRWSQNVQFFREQIALMISKQRLTPKIQQSIKQSYYNFWIDVETSLIKDKQAVCQIFQALLNVKQSVQYYTKYSNCMIRLGFYADAKNILKRSCKAFKLEFQAIKQYQNFISVYGTLADEIEFRKLKTIFPGQKVIQNNSSSKINQQNSKQQSLVQGIQDKKAIDKKQKLDKENHIKSCQQIQPQKNKSVQNKILIKHSPNQEQKGQSKTEHVEIKKQDISCSKQSNEQKKKMHTDSGNTIFLKGFPAEWKQEEIANIIKYKQKIKQIRRIQKKGVYQNYCYIQMSTGDDAAHQVEQNQFKDKYYIAISKPPISQIQNKTIFLAGLPKTVTSDKIKKIFDQLAAEIVDIRIIVNESKNIAYVDFSSAQVQQKVYETYSHKSLFIDDQKIIMRKSDRRSVQQKKQNRVVILKKLSFKAKQKDIVEFFKDYSIEDVYIPQAQKGKSKGFAFVKFKQINQFYQALQKQKGQIKGRVFQIHKSQRDIQRPKNQDKNNKQKSKQVDENVGNDYFSKFFN